MKSKKEQRISRLIMITPFDSTITQLSNAEQLLLLKGCALCAITYDLENNNISNKPAWKDCQSELGAPIVVFTLDVIEPRLRTLIQGNAPAVCAETEAGELFLLLDSAAIERCKGSVADFRGRLLYRASSLSLSLS
jgi:hypothetical protein